MEGRRTLLNGFAEVLTGEPRGEQRVQHVLSAFAGSWLWENPQLYCWFDCKAMVSDWGLEAAIKQIREELSDGFAEDWSLFTEAVPPDDDHIIIIKAICNEIERGLEGELPQRLRKIISHCGVLVLNQVFGNEDLRDQLQLTGEPTDLGKIETAAAKAAIYHIAAIYTDKILPELNEYPPVN